MRLIQHILYITKSNPSQIQKYCDFINSLDNLLNNINDKSNFYEKSLSLFVRRISFENLIRIHIPAPRELQNALSYDASSKGNSPTAPSFASYLTTKGSVSELNHAAIHFLRSKPILTRGTLFWLTGYGSRDQSWKFLRIHMGRSFVSKLQ